MGPVEYENYVAEVLAGEGWSTAVSRRSRDLGVDVVATRGAERLAVQVKMYGGSATKVNAERVMCLYGAAAYAGCGQRMLATDGQLTPEAQLVADKLGVGVRFIAATSRREPTGEGFGLIWREHIEPLAGTGLAREDGTTMAILEVDGSGLRRITSKGSEQTIEIEVFRWTIERLLAGETVTRTQIHERAAPKRVSSAVLRVLAAVPQFETVTVGRGKAVRSRAGAPVS